MRPGYGTGGPAVSHKDTNPLQMKLFDDVDDDRA